MERGGQRGGERGQTRADGEALALTKLLAVYERLYTKSGLRRRVARELWRQTISWVRAGRRGKRPKLTREQLRIALRVPEDQEAAFKDALLALGENLRILGYPRGSTTTAENGAADARDSFRPNRVACTFPIAGVSHVVYLLGPTGNDRPDGERNALWLEPIFEPLAEIAPVLVTPEFDQLEYVKFNFFTFVTLDSDSDPSWTLSGTKAEWIRTINALAFALNGGESLFPTDGVRWHDGNIELEATPIVTPNWGGGGKISIATTQEEDGRWRIELYGGMIAPLDGRQKDVRARVTSTLGASGPAALDMMSFEFVTPPGVAISPQPFAISETLYRLSFPPVSVEKFSARAQIGEGVELAASVTASPNGCLGLTLHFERTVRTTNLWRAIRDFDTALLLRESRIVSE